MRLKMPQMVNKKWLKNQDPDAQSTWLVTGEMIEEFKDTFGRRGRNSL